MFQSKLFVHRITAFLLLSAAFLAQCALLSHFQKPSKQVSNPVGQSYIVIADGENRLRRPPSSRHPSSELPNKGEPRGEDFDGLFPFPC